VNEASDMNTNSGTINSTGKCTQ